MAGVPHDEWVKWPRKKQEAFAVAMTRDELNEHPLSGRGRRRVKRYHCAALGYGPEGEDRIPVPWGTRRLLAQRYGAHPGDHVLTVKCALCDHTGEIHWYTPTPRFVYLHIDHIRPVSRGGGNDLENLRLLCPPCNMRRGNREVA